MRPEVDARTKELQRDSTSIILSTHVEPKDDIAAERQRATFNVQELSYLLNGGKDKLEKKWVHSRRCRVSVAPPLAVITNAMTLRQPRNPCPQAALRGDPLQNTMGR